MSCNRGAHNGDEHLIWGYLEPPAHLLSILRRVDLLTIDPIVTLGRSKTCDIVLPSPQISDIHCDIMWNGISNINSATIRDAGSKNGTFINEITDLGNTWHVLHEGDVINFTPPGIRSREIDYTFVFHYNAAWCPRKPQTLIGEYEIGPKLGGGARAVVFRAVHIRTGAHVALKKIDTRRLRRALIEDGQNDPNGVRRILLREVEVLVRLKHPFIVKFEGLYRVGEDTYIILEFVEGGTLDQWLDEFNRLMQRYLTECEVKHFAFQIFEAIRYCHQRGITHRDVKPENILLTSDGDVRLADLGEAVLCDGLTARAPTFVGTPAYMAPEVAIGEIGRPSDVFSAGMVICELLTGWKPRRKDAHKMRKAWVDYIYEELAHTGLSDPCIEWLLNVLDEDPHTRLTAAGALDHEWLAPYAEEHAIEFPESNLDVHKDFRRPGRGHVFASDFYD